MSDKGDKGGNRRNRKTVRVKSARGRKPSSTRWLQRQLNDPYVAQAKADGYRSRAAYKLKEIQEKFTLFKPGDSVVDLGAAPGGWLQVAREYVGRGTIVGIDLIDIDPIPNVEFIHGDFEEDGPLKELEAITPNGVNVVMSDMAAASCGHATTDHIRIIALCELALDFAIDHLATGGHFCAKVLRGGSEQELLGALKRHFTSVKHFKPEASRKESAEIYVIAKGFKGRD